MYFFKYKPTYNIGCAFSFTLIMEILNKTIQFRRKFGNYATAALAFSDAAKERNPVRLPVMNRDKTSK